MERSSEETQLTTEKEIHYIFRLPNQSIAVYVFPSSLVLYNPFTYRPTHRQSLSPTAHFQDFIVSRHLFVAVSTSNDVYVYKLTPNTLLARKFNLPFQSGSQSALVNGKILFSWSPLPGS